MTPDEWAMLFLNDPQSNALDTQDLDETHLPPSDERPAAIAAQYEASATPGVLYGLTVFVSAFLLFEVQPIIAKLIVPWFGGSSSVWTTCLVFFQVALLAGYVYAYWFIQCLRPRLQTSVHLVLLALGVLVLPILPSPGWKPAGPERAVLHILLLLAATVGLPYFLLSTSGPLLQAWWAQTRRSAQPYRLFALSNAGSMLALLTYPVLVEPFFSTRHQAIGWSLAFVMSSALCATLAVRRKRAAGAAFEPAQPQPRPSRAVQALWVALTACASTLLLAITNHLSQEVVAIPFLWILPLSVYLLSFILCFEGRGWYRRDLFLWILPVALGGMTYALAHGSSKAPLALLIPLYCGGLFVSCMVCHGELARLKPPAQQLTSFYLMCSLGGATGGVFVGLLAPHLFRDYLELPIGLAGCAALTLLVLYRNPRGEFYKTNWQRARLALVVLTLALIGAQIRKTAARRALMVRNFYGSLKVIDKEDESDPEDSTRELVNGTIDHGEEFLAPGRRRQPTTYYGPDSGVGLVLRLAGQQGRLRVGVIGLGAGTLAAYSRPGDHYIFYELNPLVIELAWREFYFLRDSEAQIDIVPGDARLSLERQSSQDFDVLVVDAFTGDAVPVHLLTREAFLLYFRHLKQSGVLAVHVSNRYLNLKPVVQRVSESLGKQAVVVDSDEDEENAVYRAIWVLVSGRHEFFSEPDIKKAGAQIPATTGLWTDDHSSLIGTLKWFPGPG